MAERSCKKCFHYKACKEVSSHSGYGDISYTESQCKHYIPTVDVAEVTRCKDCKHCPDIKTKTKGMVWCRKFRTEVHPNGFCSYGERSTPTDRPD